MCLLFSPWPEGDVILTFDIGSLDLSVADIQAFWCSMTWIRSTSWRKIRIDDDIVLFHPFPRFVDSFVRFLVHFLSVSLFASLCNIIDIQAVFPYCQDWCGNIDRFPISRSFLWQALCTEVATVAWVVLNGTCGTYAPEKAMFESFLWDWLLLKTLSWAIFDLRTFLCVVVFCFGLWRSSWHCHQLDWGMNIDECQQNLSKIWARAFWYHWHRIMPVLEYWTKSGSIWPTPALLPDKFFIL